MSQPNRLHDREPSDPTPEQIEQRSAEVRGDGAGTWRHGVSPSSLRPWTPPLVYTTELVREFNNGQDA